jgi:hypothetical protein
MDLALVGISFTVFMPKSSTNVSGLRALRALRPLRSIKGMPGMRVLVATLIESIPLMLDVLFLIGFVFIVFGIIGQEVRSLSPCNVEQTHSGHEYVCLLYHVGLYGI